MAIRDCEGIHRLWCAWLLIARLHKAGEVLAIGTADIVGYAQTIRDLRCSTRLEELTPNQVLREICTDEDALTTAADWFSESLNGGA